MVDRPLVSDWTADWDFYGRQYHDDAPAVWQELRDACPFARTERYGGAWVALRYEDVVAAAHDTSTFRSFHTSLEDDYSVNKADFPPLDLNPPEHGPFRRLLLPLFGPRAVEALRPRVEEICASLLDGLDGLDGRTEIDAALDYARHVPMSVTATMLGVPDADGDRFRGWVHDIVERPDQTATVAAALREAIGYFRSLVVARREDPGDDLISLLAHSELDGEPLTDRRITSAAVIMMLASLDTVWTTLGAALLHLAEHPDDLRRLRDEPALLEGAVEEFLRFYAPAELSRCVATDVDFAGHRVRAGEHLLLSFPAANRDPAAFPDADRFIIDRAENRHLAFGVGIHRCIGSNVARMELAVALGAWIHRFPHFSIDPSRPVEMTEGGGIRGPRRVPVRIG
ncbi:MAG: cytochrome P450 [Acidimicrobiia bacterium]